MYMYIDYSMMEHRVYTIIYLKFYEPKFYIQIKLGIFN